MEVQRLSPEREVVYKHTYDSFDLAGKITSMTLIGNGGKASFTYDALALMSTASYGLWEEELKYGPTGDVTRKTIRDPLCPSGGIPMVGHLSCRPVMTELLISACFVAKIREHTRQCQQIT